MTDTVLVINAGSSSIKFALFEFNSNSPRTFIRGKIVNIGQCPTLKAVDENNHDLCEHERVVLDPQAQHEDLIQWLLDWFHRHDHGYTVKVVGHRVVHGGRDFLSATKITAQVLTQLEALIPLAPLHQPHNLAAIKAIAKWAPHLPQIACFDTSFHRTQKPLAQLFAIPKTYSDKGIIRYGFHGLSYQYIANCLPKYLGEQSNGRIIVAHLGNGASMCALLQGQSVATSMGFTALDGLMMGQRCGSIDAGVVIHLVREYKMSIEDVEHMLYNESGLLGVSGISNNMQVLQQSNEPTAKQAIDLFCYRAARELASLVASINGIDAIVFTAGIGEKSALVRQQICEQLSWLGVRLDAKENQVDADVISHIDSLVKVLVIPTNEELVIAKASMGFISMQ